jgi:osmoprotectant transport system ATP-binding protein
VQIQLQRISHHYAERTVLTDVSLTFAHQKITVLIGRSGSGKSTLLRMVNGLIQPTEGEVRLQGQLFNYSDPSGERLKMGYVVQGVGLFPHLTVRQNISIASRLQKQKSDPQKRVLDLLAQVGLSPSYQSKFPHELSGGEQQRVGLCRALFLDPPVLLMDEPFGALDPITRHEIQHEVLRLQKDQPRTMILVTHDMREAQKLADDIVVLENGVVIQADSKENVLQRPSHPVVRSLIEAAFS